MNIIKKLKIDNVSLAFTLSIIPVFLVSRYKVLQRVSNSEYGLFDIIQASANDILILSLIAFIITKLIKNKLAYIFIFLISTLSIFNCIYFVKMGSPITYSLLNQIGNFMMLKTSITAKSSTRGLIFFIILVGVQNILWIVLYFINQKIKKIEVINKVVFFIVLFPFICGLFLQSEKNKNFSKNIVESIIIKPQSVMELLNNKEFSGFKYNLVENAEIKLKDYKDHNVLLIIVETLSAKYFSDEKLFKKVMPNMHKYSAQSLKYLNHYTPWPHSTKALYSMICGRMPYISPILEMRLNPTHNCNSWFKKINELNYSSWLAYSGSLSYDNMNTFFKTRGFKRIIDKPHLLKNKDYKKNNFAIDDISLVDSFEIFLNKSSKPFFATAITLNSHHPYWNPENKVFEDNYDDSIHYQDKIIGKFIKVLKDKSLLDNTIVIITGDHGVRSTDKSSGSTLAQNMFKTPLIVLHPKKENKEIQKPSSHEYLGNSILEWLGFDIEDHNTLDNNDGVFVFYYKENLEVMKIMEKKSFLYSESSGMIFEGEEWVDNRNSKCPKSEKRCAGLYQNIYNLFNESINLYPQFEGE